jgi:YHS domain-containing protein
MKHVKSKLVLIGLIALIGIGIVACTRTEGVDLVDKDSSGYAVRGFDTVAYFVAQNAVQGDSKFEYTWNGAKWLFSSLENLEKFKAAPENYAPQFGGYCAYAVSHGHTADGDPQAWKIVDGKLYLNYSPEVKQMWEKEQDKFIIDGQKNWPELQKNKPDHQ